MMKRVAVKSGLVVAGLALAVGLGAQHAEARTFVAVGVGVPFYDPYYPYYYAPPPVVYAPPPVVVQPAAPAYVAPQSPSWYYCDNPQGYYPYVSTCTTGWRQVPAAPPPGGH
jgi:hypothetical protein